MPELQNKILTVWQAERPRWILWLPVLLGVGIGLYFGMENEPSRWLWGGMTLGGVAAFALLHRYALLRNCLLAATCIAAGIALGAWRTHHVAAPVLERDIFPQAIEGTVHEITTRPDSTRLTLGEVAIPSLTAEDTPAYVTVSLRQHAPEEIALGDRIGIRAGFFPPPQPVIPNGYAFNRHFYFLRIGATGFAPGSEQPVILRKATEESGTMAVIARIRHNIAQWLMQHMTAPEGAIAAALMVGEAKAIPEPVYEAMRQSGLVHVLSISGMHLSLAAGILFFSVRFIFAAIPAFAVRYDGKKAAAILALIGSFAYLLLAGQPISAQRAFVMVALVLLAVLLDRNVTPIRSLCLAALVILLIAPESLLNPGFQLSFAATLGILAYYEYWREKPYQPTAGEWDWKKRQRHFWGGIISTSVIATLATTPFILHHFEDLPSYSVLGNLLVMPLVSFLIMPCVVIVLLLLPFGVAGVFLPILSWGIGMMVWLAEWVSSLPYAVISFPPLSMGGLVAITLGGLWLCLWQQPWRHAGWLLIIGGFASLHGHTPPDMAISADGKKIALRTAPDKVVMLRGMRDGFVQDGWLRFMRVDAFGLRKDAPDGLLRCDDLGCIANLPQHRLAVIRHRAALAEDCGHADMLVAPYWSVYYEAKRLCPDTPVYDRSWLAKAGGAVFWFDAGGGIRYRTVAEMQGNRPWSQSGH